MYHKIYIIKIKKSLNKQNQQKYEFIRQLSFEHCY